MAEFVPQHSYGNTSDCPSAISDVKADGADGVANGKVVTEENGKKERSVLQAKLTRLAIQIGYAGQLRLSHGIQLKLCSDERSRAGLLLEMLRKPRKQVV